MLSLCNINRDADDDGPSTPITPLPPLPIDTYPRILEPTRRGSAYYITLIALLAIRSIMPLSGICIIIFPIILSNVHGGSRIVACVFAGYALAEVVFAVYHRYQIYQIQSRPAGIKIPDESRNALVHKILGMDLSTPSLQVNTWNTCGSQNGSVDADHFDLTAEKAGDINVEDSSLGDGRAEKSESSISLRLDDHQASSKQTRREAEQVEFRERLRTWFNHAPWESLRRENVLIWLSWVSLDLPLSEARKNTKFIECLDHTLEKLAERTGHRIPEGYNPSVRANMPTLDPIVIKGRPLLLYAVPALVNAFLRNITFPSWGLKKHSDGEIDYLVRIPPGWTPDGIGHQGPPLIYLHGLGFGMMSSFSLVNSLIKNHPDRPLLTPLQPHTSQSIFHPRHLQPWTRVELVESISRTCTKFGFWSPAIPTAGGIKGGCSILSHSNGSVAHAWILKDLPSLVLRNTFVDPIVFCTWEGDMTHSVCYRKPSTAMELLLDYLIATEIGIAHYIRRHFDWTENTLFFDEMPGGRDHSRTAFFLGGKDMVIDASRARKYLELHGVTRRSLHWDPDGPHGGAMLGDSLGRVVSFAGSGSSRRTTKAKA